MRHQDVRQKIDLKLEQSVRKRQVNQLALAIQAFISSILVSYQRVASFPESQVDLWGVPVTSGEVRGHGSRNCL